MTGLYTLAKFLRSAPHPLTQQYLGALQLGSNVLWQSLRDRTVAPIEKCIAQAQQDTREQIDGDFRAVWEVAKAGGYDQIKEAAALRGCSIDAEAAHEASPLEFAFSILINHPLVFEDSRRLVIVDGLTFEHRADLPEAPDALCADSIKRFKACLSEYYSEFHAKGRNCEIETFERGEQHILYCFLEDHPETRQVFTDDRQLGITRLRPAFEVIFIYNPAEATLQTCVKGGAAVREAVERAFGRTLLGVDIGPAPPKDVIFDLEPLLRGEFDFGIEPDDGLDHAVLRTLKLRFRNPPHRAFTIEVGVSAPRNAVWRVMDDVFSSPDINRRDVVVQMAGIDFVFEADPRGKKERRSVRVAAPSSCALKGDRADDVIRQCLRRWRIALPRTAPENPQLP